MSVAAEIEIPTADVAVAEMEAAIEGRSGSKKWKDRTEITSYSATGAGFRTGRECRTGTLVKLKLPLPPYLRAFDHDRKDYGVWGLVQHCQRAELDGKVVFHVGVAFIGK